MELEAHSKAIDLCIMIQVSWSQVRILMRILQFLNLHNPSSLNMALRFTQPLGIISNGNVLGG
jgi:hypothetical protein